MYSFYSSVWYFCQVALSWYQFNGELNVLRPVVFVVTAGKRRNCNKSHCGCSTSCQCICLKVKIKWNITYTANLRYLLLSSYSVISVPDSHDLQIKLVRVGKYPRNGFFKLSTVLCFKLAELR